jgi:hypothetical protein
MSLEGPQLRQTEQINPHDRFYVFISTAYGLLGRALSMGVNFINDHPQCFIDGQDVNTILMIQPSDQFEVTTS